MAVLPPPHHTHPLKKFACLQEDFQGGEDGKRPGKCERFLGSNYFAPPDVEGERLEVAIQREENEPLGLDVQNDTTDGLVVIVSIRAESAAERCGKLQANACNEKSVSALATLCAWVAQFVIM